MIQAVERGDAPRTNKAARKRLSRLARDAVRCADLERDGYEAFRDMCYWDMVCVRPTGSRAFDDTVHVNSFDEAHLLIDFLSGRREDLPNVLRDPLRDRALVDRWLDRTGPPAA